MAPTTMTSFPLLTYNSTKCRRSKRQVLLLLLIQVTLGPTSSVATAACVLLFFVFIKIVRKIVKIPEWCLSKSNIRHRSLHCYQIARNAAPVYKRVIAMIVLFFWYLNIEFKNAESLFGKTPKRYSRYVCMVMAPLRAYRKNRQTRQY